MFIGSTYACPNEMKSELMTAGVSKDFYEDLTKLHSVGLQAFKSATDAFVEASRRETNVQAKEWTDIAHAHNLDASTLRSSVSICIFIFDFVRNHGDKLADIVDDLVKLQKTDNPKDLLEKLLCFEKAQEALDFASRKAAMRASLPVFEGVRSRTVFTFSVEPEFDLEVDDLAKYSPTRIQPMPSVVLTLTVNNFGEQETTALALTPRQLDDMIRHLEFARFQLQKTKEKFIR